MGWKLPTSHNANTNQWHNPTNCYDGNSGTYGYDDVYPWPFSGYYIEFNISEIQCNKIRFYAKSTSSNADKIDIDVYYGGAWHNVYYRGTFSNLVWVEASLGGDRAVTKARVRFFNSSVLFLREGRLYEFNFYEIYSGPTGWINEPHAYDDNTGTEASCFTPPLSWTPWLVRELPEAIYSEAVKFYAQYQGTSGINRIDLYIYYNDDWYRVFIGSYMDQVWIEKTFSSYHVSKMRVKFYNNSSDDNTAYIGEMQFVEDVGIPKVTTNAATGVTDEEAILNGDITSLGGADDCNARGFKYKEVKATITGTGIAFVDGGGGEDTITDTGNGFTDAGFEAGDVFTVAGSASNDGDYTILSVIAGTINIVADSLTTEGVGATVNIYSMDTEQSVLSDGNSFQTGVFSENISSLDSTKKYYFQAYAINEEGTGYGDWLSFGVDVVVPTVTTSAATSTDHEKAVLHGNIILTGGQDPEERGFQYKVSDETRIRTIRETGTFGVGTYSLDFDGLDPNIKYTFRAYAINDKGTGYGSWLDTTTDYTDPIVITHSATGELETKVTGNGEIVSTGGADCDEVGFEYGLSRTPTWLKNEIGSYGVEFFDLLIDGLTANTEYWYRAYAKRYKE